MENPPKMAYSGAALKESLPANALQAHALQVGSNFSQESNS
jgi:hypothetical protein